MIRLLISNSGPLRRAGRKNRTARRSFRSSQSAAPALRGEMLEQRRLLDSGGLDPTFGNGGIAAAFNSHNASAYSVLAEPNGKIVVAGMADVNGKNEFAVARFTSDGHLDTTFGDGGIVITAIGTEAAGAYGVALQPDGKIVAVGDSTEDSRVNATLVRYNDDGSLDAGFGQNGIVTTPIGKGEASADAVAIEADGKIVVGGTASFGFALARYNADGSLDTTFADGGVDTITAGASDLGEAYALAIQADGKIVALGGGNDFAVVRVNPDGSLDSSFGAGGFVNTTVGGILRQPGAVVVQPDGRIIVGGTATLPGKPPPPPPPPPGTASPDTASLDTASPDTASLDTASPAIVVLDPTYDGFGLVRYNADGTLDTTFGDAGTVITKVGGGGDRVTNLGLEADGRIVAAGRALANADDTGSFAFGVAVYSTNGSLDSHFAVSGTLVVTAGATESGGFAATLDSHGAVLLADGAGSDDQHQSLTVGKVLVDNPSSAPTAAIDLLYQQLLGRAPDAAGVAYWTAQFAGGTSVSKVAADFLNSAEYLERTIGQDYHDLLHRAADPQGLSFFVSRVQAGGMDLDQVADDLLASSELWQASGATSSGWVEALYTRVLGRPADAAGSQYFTAQLDAQTLSRRQVAAMVLASPEDFAREVAGWYEQFLGRAPSAAEQAVAVSALAAGESAPSIIAALIGGANSR